MAINPLQLVISMVLFFVFGFGIGFIFNMVLRTTWMPVGLAVIAIAGVLAYHGIVPGVLDILILVFGLIGAVLSGWTIQWLRKKGYRMF